ncbi:hypothetical protein F2Q70_00010005 [Brassica cretica]|uniref:Uncharacterized protein n=1 Tax=Brassica cretica TaxID=69181 RepID=A0A8S9J6Y9_BRACR|nr:hypothetical protein F2Q68_00002995 [Brassica cretica]KAF2612845.1 hypothetical protein F2Q70_00010005 [Brassica cretica]
MLLNEGYHGLTIPVSPKDCSSRVLGWTCSDTNGVTIFGGSAAPTPMASVLIAEALSLKVAMEADVSSGAQDLGFPASWVIGSGQAAVHFTRESFTWAGSNPVPLWCPEEAG